MGRNRLVMVADPDAESRAQTVELLRGAPYAVVADTDLGREASLIATETQPEILLVAVEDPLEPALQTIEEIRARLPRCEVVIYSGLHDAASMRRVMQLGVRDQMKDRFKAVEEIVHHGHLMTFVEEARGEHDTGVSDTACN